LLRVRLLAVAVLGTMLAGTACGKVVRGHGVPGDPTGAGVSGTAPVPGLPAYQPPADGSGYSAEPFDQPQPLPALLSARGCDWLAKVKPGLHTLGAKSAAVSPSGCQLLFAKGEIAQVHVNGPYSEVTDTTTYLKPDKIADVQARFYSFVDQKTDTICSVEMNPRSLTDITVDGYNAKESGGSFSAHCQLAGRVATFIARTFVPAAGGTPWPGTPQQPSHKTLARAKPCGIVDKGAIIYANDMTDEHPRSGAGPLGLSCDYRNADYGSIHVLLTRSTGGLKALPVKAGAAVSAVRAGVMQARTEQTATSCAFSVQFVTGQVAQLTYSLGSRLTDNSFRATTCNAARAVMSASLVDFMSQQ
jgi:hypothetical protein